MASVPDNKMEVKRSLSSSTDTAENSPEKTLSKKSSVVLPNRSLLCNLGLTKTFSPKKSSFSRFFCLKVVFF